MKRRVLFVDDEAQVLDGLRDLLYRQRKRWDMVFVLDGEAALRALEDAPFDVIVSDSRMPEMDGASLLGRVKELHPATARLVLSGYSDRDAVMAALPVAHQFLSKPCDVDALVTAVERACSLGELLPDEGLRRLVGGLGAMPSDPRVYRELVAVTARSDLDHVGLAAVIERDPAMALKVLQLVNTSFFGPAKRHVLLRGAVATLGVELIKDLVRGVFVAPPQSAHGALDALWRHARVTARLARRLVSDPLRAGEAFTAALLHDLGRAVLLAHAPAALDDDSRGPHGAMHASVGAYALGLWGLPRSLMDAVAYHHRPDLAGERRTDAVVVVHAANALAGAHAFDLGLVAQAGFGEELPRWRAAAEEELRAAEGETSW